MIFFTCPQSMWTSEYMRLRAGKPQIRENLAPGSHPLSRWNFWALTFIIRPRNLCPFMSLDFIRFGLNSYRLAWAWLVKTAARGGPPAFPRYQVHPSPPASPFLAPSFLPASPQSCTPSFFPSFVLSCSNSFIMQICVERENTADVCFMIYDTIQFNKYSSL